MPGSSGTPTGRHTLASRLDRLDTLLFHKALGSYRAKAERLASLAEWHGAEALRPPADAADARRARRASWPRPTSSPTWCASSPNCRASMGGIYAREEGEPEAVWKAIYYQYLPMGVEAGGPPTREQLGDAAASWAAVSLADKLDSVVGLFSAGERPTGTRDPFGLRRQVQGRAEDPRGPARGRRHRSGDRRRGARARRRGRVRVGRRGAFDAELRAFVLRPAAPPVHAARLPRRRDRRGAGRDRCAGSSPLAVRRRLEALQAMRGSDDFAGLAVLFKRVKNIAREISDAPRERTIESLTAGSSSRPSRRSSRSSTRRRRRSARRSRRATTAQAMSEAAALRPAVDRFFTEVFVMAEDPALRAARLMLMVSCATWCCASRTSRSWAADTDGMTTLPRCRGCTRPIA